MTSEIEPTEKEDKKVNVDVRSSSETLYGLGLFGAWYYYISKATTFQEGFVGFVKGFFWPAILVFKLFVFLEGMDKQT